MTILPMIEFKDFHNKNTKNASKINILILFENNTRFLKDFLYDVFSQNSFFFPTHSENIFVHI